MGSSETVGLRDSVNASDEITVELRHYISEHHLWTAAHDARLCRQLEEELIGTGILDPRHFASATGAIFFAVAYVETVINEFFEDAMWAVGSRRVRHLEAQVLEKMASYWESGGKRHPFLDKYLKALKICGAQRIDRGSQIYSDCDLLRDIRNNLTHYRPTWNAVGVKNELDLKVVAAGIEPSEVYSPDDGRAWVPFRVAGAGGAAWACRTAVNFVSEWRRRIGLPDEPDIDSSLLPDW